MTIIKKLSFILAFAFTLAIPQQILAQEKVEISEEIVEVNNMQFYIHTVKTQQTLYSISKAYGIDVAEIYKYNPDSRNVIEIGQQLKIPKLDKATAADVDEKAPAKEEAKPEANKKEDK